jgi:hypothetical protein
VTSRPDFPIAAKRWSPFHVIVAVSMNLPPANPL